MSLLDISGLAIRYGDTAAVADVELALEAGESVGLVGESGSGKTQTALAILGLLPGNAEVSGSIRFAGTELVGADERSMNRLRAKRMSIVFQDPMQALNPYLRIGRQLRRILIRHGLASGRTADERVVQMLDRVGLPDPEIHVESYPHQLSGGMQQRAMIASALIAEPDLLVADEPTTALDVTVQAQILDLLERIRENTALLLITHDLGIVAGRCERMVVLRDGYVVEAGQTARVFGAPQHAHTAALIAAAPRLDRAAARPAANGDPVLEIESASVSYVERGGWRRLHAVSDLDLTVRRGETVAVVGESGSGKSSFVRGVLGLVPLEAGRVTFCGMPLPDDVRTRARSVRKDLALVFQDPLGSLNPQLRVQHIVGEPLSVHAPDLADVERRRAVVTILERVGLGAACLDRYPHELSGGQAQRVAIARALILRPKVLVCDEAVAALDGSARKQVLALFETLQREHGLSIIFISHDLAVVRGISHRILVMYMGKLVELADSAVLFARPRHPYTRALLDAVPVPDPLAPGGTSSLPGEMPSAFAPPSGCAFHPRCAHADERCAAERPVSRIVEGTTVACHRAEEIEL